MTASLRARTARTSDIKPLDEAESGGGVPLRQALGRPKFRPGPGCGQPASLATPHPPVQKTSNLKHVNPCSPIPLARCTTPNPKTIQPLVPALIQSEAKRKKPTPWQYNQKPISQPKSFKHKSTTNNPQSCTLRPLQHSYDTQNPLQTYQIPEPTHIEVVGFWHTRSLKC